MWCNLWLEVVDLVSFYIVKPSISVLMNHLIRRTTRMSSCHLSNHGRVLESIARSTSNILNSSWATHRMHSRSRNNEFAFAELLPPTINGTWCNDHETIGKWWFLLASSKLIRLLDSASRLESHRWASIDGSNVCDIARYPNHSHADKFP